MTTYAENRDNIDTDLSDAETAILAVRSHLKHAHLGDALERLTAARRTLEATETDLVMLMRSGGTPWQQIGDLFGITRQAAQQRYGAGSTNG